MTDQATETEKALMKDGKSRLPGISERQAGAAKRDYFFTAVAIVFVAVIAVFAFIAISYWRS